MVDDASRIAHTFRRAPDSGYIAESSGFIASPPRVIAAIILCYWLMGEVTLPDGWDRNTLHDLMEHTKFTGRQIAVSEEQARALSGIGEQLLQLGSAGDIEPPLTGHQAESIRHLIGLVQQGADSDA